MASEGTPTSAEGRLEIAHISWHPEHGLVGEDQLNFDPQLVLAFGSFGVFSQNDALAALRRFDPKTLIGASTGGTVQGTQVTDASVMMTAVRFRSSRVRTAHVKLGDHATSFDAGVSLGQELLGDALRSVFVLSNGLNVNGSEVLRGLAFSIPEGVPISGGLAADGADFARTMILAGGENHEHALAAVAFYGADLRVGCGFAGGWSAFGPERVISRASGNLLYELDGCSALKLYRDYLGPHASGLPATALRFPLSVRALQKASPQVVRTILGIDEAEQAMRFAGDMPEGHLARFMFSNTARLVDGAGLAAKRALERHGGTPQLGLLVSCVGRRLLMGQETEEELEAVAEQLPGCSLSGFYANGEVCHTAPGEALHNQTMTVTLMSEN